MKLKNLKQLLVVQLERFGFKSFLIIFLLITNFATVIYLYSYKETFLSEYNNPFPLLDISRNFISQNNFIVNLQPLRDDLQEIYKKYGESKIALYLEFLNSGANISYNQDVRYYPASLIKMPVAIASAKKIQDGQWKWDSELVIFQEDVDTKFGNVGNNPIGTRLTIEELMRELLTNSDNTAYKMLLRNLGAGPVNDFLVQTGLDDFFDQDLNITAKEYTRLFRSLYTSSYLSREYSEKILQLLSESPRNYLGQSIPANVQYSHKFGENGVEKIFADSGIVYIPDRPFVVTLLYKADSTENKDDVDHFFKETGDTIFNYFNNYKI